MADLDAELLALAGEDSSEDELPRQRTQDSPSEGERDASPDTDAAARTRPASRRTKRAPRRKARRTGSEEDGEASATSDNDSAPMEQSEEEGHSSQDETSATVFPVDGRFYSEKDKEEILALPEFQREVILAERAQILQRQQQDRHLRNLADRLKDSDSMGRKRQAESAGIEDGGRKSTRQRKNLAGQKVGEVSSSLEAYKEQRAKRGERKALSSGRRQQRRSESPSDVDAEGESEVEWDSGKPKQDAGHQYESPAELVDFNRIHVGRHQFAQYCFYPTFEETVKDCYIRVSIHDQGQAQGENVYRMAKIEGIKVIEDKPYAIENEKGLMFRCTKHAVASVGKTKRDWPFIFCSSKRFTERELARYKSLMATEQLPLPKKSAIESKINQINALINYSFTEQELNKKLADSGVLEAKQKAREKTLLLGKRSDAQREGNKELMQRLDEQIRELEGSTSLFYGTSLYKSTPQKTKKSEGERLAEINRAVRKANTENVRRAQIAERKAAAKHRARVERGEATADPFARVKILPKTHFDINANLGSAAKQKLTEEQIAKRMAEEKATEEVQQAKKAMPEALAKLMAGETEAQPGKIDFSKYDIMYQFGRLSQKKPPGQQSIFKRKLFDQEILGTYDLGIHIDLD